MHGWCYAAVNSLHSFDVIIVGLGAMGSAAAYHLARRGLRVLGFDRFTPPHAFGSSHGESRVIREAYFEHPLYVPMVQRAYELWAELEQEIRRTLLLQTGGLMIGAPDSALVSGARRSAEVHHLAHEMLSASELRRRYPFLRPSDETVAVWEPRAGILFPEACVQAHLEMARRYGALIQCDEPVMTWQPDGEGVRVVTMHGQYRAERLLFTAGAWVGELLADLALPLTVERQVFFWFAPRAHPDQFLPERCPIYLWQYDEGPHFYGFPDMGPGSKVAQHHRGQTTDPQNVRRVVGSAEIEAIQALLRRYVPDVEGQLLAIAVCLYTNTPDYHFLIDFHPANRQVVIASPCSGHGFKFSCAIGEIVAELLTRGESRLDLTPFALVRLRQPM